MSSTTDYINNSYQSRTDTVAKAYRKAEKGKLMEGQDPQEFLDELPLAVDTKIVVSIVLSTGGPHEEIECEVSKSRRFAGYELDRATFGAYWGGEKRETRLSEGEPLYRFAESIIENMGYDA